MGVSRPLFILIPKLNLVFLCVGRGHSGDRISQASFTSKSRFRIPGPLVTLLCFVTPSAITSDPLKPHAVPCYCEIQSLDCRFRVTQCFSDYGAWSFHCILWLKKIASETIAWILPVTVSIFKWLSVPDFMNRYETLGWWLWFTLDLLGDSCMIGTFHDSGR